MTERAVLYRIESKRLRGMKRAGVEPREQIGK